MKESIKGYCYFIYNEGIVQFTAKDYILFAVKAVGYTIKGLYKLITG